MKKTMMTMSFAAILITGACNNATSNSEKEGTVTTNTNEPAKDTASFQAIDTAKLAKGAMYYQCSMHPEVITDKPGDCPKCGMKLVMKHKSD